MAKLANLHRWASPFSTISNMTRRRGSQGPSHSTRHSNGADTHGSVAGTPPYTVREEPIGTAKHVRIVGIGAGASGINMVRTLRRSLSSYEHVIYEKNEKVGGTWFENRYPGCRCDVPSHNYQFSWRPNPEWSNFFSSSAEIEQYLSRICEEEHMMDVIKTRHKVVGAWWDEDRGLWDVSVLNLDTGTEFRDQANFLIDASGILNHPKWPDIPDRESFRGDVVHTASWPSNFCYANKTVALIGNGSSGIQLLPAIQPKTKKLYHFIRTPTWVIPPRITSMTMLGGPAKSVLSEIELDEKENFSQRQIEKFKLDPEFYHKFVKTIERDINGTFPLVLNGSPAQVFAASKVVQYMTALLGGDEKLCEALIPKFPLGCRRITPAPGYLEALRTPNTEVITEAIAAIVPEGIQLESGEVIKVDAIICATGFDNSFAPRFPLVGREGNVQDIMKAETPQGYMSCALAGVPNYFTFLGPNAPIGHGSVFTLSEHIARYIARVISKCQTEGIRALAPSGAAVADYAAHVAAFMPRTAWAAPCRSWFKGGEETGPVTALHPGSRLHFFHMLERFRGEDWEYTYDGSENRFAYLGNGFSTRELDPCADPTWYLEEEADRPARW
ncbi:FAD/NAD(P)-binding domain-containing protein [Durotheca rogersii]|uniref:FAD/NAD(P)-binding domain-containing protein n=1 Tax=Durotheca rogersii TaxID=419775 RepID=UPI002220846D|nr:FAD/NAD(P)-binding domain-containing protein [Durotheca rogersii]KAI5861733.1 FAD/NAD(P)-binding domain-containing protein [Durotheca rogersii]